MEHHGPPTNIYDPKPAPVDQRQEATVKMASALGLQEGDIAVLVIEKREAGGLHIESEVIQKAHVHSPPNTLRSLTMELINKFLKNRKSP
jgi:hypothetical protein